MMGGAVEDLAEPERVCIFHDGPLILALLRACYKERYDWLEQAMPSCPAIGLELNGMTSESCYVLPHCTVSKSIAHFIRINIIHRVDGNTMNCVHRVFL